MRGTGGDAVVKALKALDVDTVFTIISVHNIPILDAIYREGSIKIIDCRHEQNATHAADGYSRATGKLGVCITSTGPGAANAAGGIFEADFASSPIMMITGQVESRYYMAGKGFLHEAEQQLPFLQAISKQAYSVARNEDIMQAVVDAGRTALSGRKGPTTIEIPVDLQYTEFEMPDVPAVDIIPGQPRQDRIDAAAKALSEAKKPIIWAGGGVIASDGAEALRKFIDRVQIPVATSTNGRGAISEDSDLCLGNLTSEAPIQELFAEADVVMAIGTHFQMGNTLGWSMPMGKKLVHIDADQRSFDRNYVADITVLGDARLAIEAIDKAVSMAQREDEWVAKAKKAREDARANARAGFGEIWCQIMDSMRNHMPDDGPIVRDATVPAYTWGNRMIPIREPRTSMMSSSAAIGPGLPLAIGACVGSGKRTAVIHGDGGIMLSIGDLPVLAQYNLPLTVCVFNDRGYGVLRRIQSQTFEGTPAHDVDLATPDFAKLAEACGIKGVNVASAEEFEKAFAESVASDGPMVIDIDTRNFPSLMQGGKQRLLSEDAE